MPRIHANRARSQPFNQSRQLFNGFALRRERNERRRDLRVSRLRVEQCLEQLPRFCAVQIFTTHETREKLR